MIYCNNCGKQLQEGSKFCFSCGSPVINSAQAESSSKRRAVYDGEIHKCPNCGSHLNSFEHKCKDCGYELRSFNTTNVVKEFSDKLGKTDSFAKKNELISNFYIPNTKEDIYEFFILAISNLTTDYKCEKAWESKLEQTYHKAKLSFGNTSEFEYIDKLYNKTMKQYKSKSFNRLLRTGWKYILGALLFIIGLIMIVFGFFKGSESGDPDSPFYMVSMMGLFALMVGIGIFVWGTEKKSSLKIKVKEDDEDDNDEDY